MSDLTLSDGREIDIDLYQLSIKEFRALLDPQQPEDEGDEIIARVVGMELSEVQALAYPDYRLLTKSFWEKARNVNLDPEKN